jgi:hypothetical protein
LRFGAGVENKLSEMVIVNGVVFVYLNFGGESESAFYIMKLELNTQCILKF